MDNKNNRQTDSTDNNQDILNQYTSSIKTDTPETNTPLNLPKSEEKEPLKDFNSTPIDTPTPTPLSNNLEPSKNLNEGTSLIVEDKTEPSSESESKAESTNLIIPEPEDELKPKFGTKSNLEPEPNPKVESEKNYLSGSENELGLKLAPGVEPELNDESGLKEKFMSEAEPKTEPDIELNPLTSVEPELNTDNNSESIIQTETSSSSEPSEDPEMIKQKIAEVLSYDTASETVNSSSDKPKVSKVLKVLFIISLIIFLGVVGGLAYFILNPSLKTNPETKVVPTTAPVQSNVTCELNGFIYTLNQSFPSADGCNTCTCVSADNIACTEKACADVTTTPATKSATSLTVTPVSANKTVLGTGNYVGKTPFDPDKVKIGDIVLDKFRVAEKTTNKYFFTKIYTTPVDKGVDIDGSNISFFFDKNKIVVCDGLPCCFPGEENKAENWQEEWCTGY